MSRSGFTKGVFPWDIKAVRRIGALRVIVVAKYASPRLQRSPNSFDPDFSLHFTAHSIKSSYFREVVATIGCLILFLRVYGLRAQSNLIFAS